MMYGIGLGLIALATLLATLRMLLGPTASDRAVALDAVTTITTGALLLLGITVKRVIFLDVALVYAVLGFITTLAFARYIEGGL